MLGISSSPSASFKPAQSIRTDLKSSRASAGSCRNPGAVDAGHGGNQPGRVVDAADYSVRDGCVSPLGEQLLENRSTGDRLRLAAFDSRLVAPNQQLLPSVARPTPGRLGIRPVPGKPGGLSWEFHEKAYPPNGSPPLPRRIGRACALPASACAPSPRPFVGGRARSRRPSLPLFYKITE